MEILSIWYEFDEWSENIDANDCNSDIVFTLSDGSKWCTTLYTYQSIITISKKNQSTGELLSGQYFYAPKPIFVSSMRKEIILSVLNDIIKNEKDLSNIFTRVD